MEKRRSLSGIYLLYKFDEEDSNHPTTFEDCPEEKQDEWLDTLDIEATRRLAKQLANSLRRVGDELDIESKY